jgi:hypothetical protein
MAEDGIVSEGRGVVAEGAEGDGVRSVVVVQRAGADRNKGGGIWDHLFEYNDVFGRKTVDTWAAAAAAAADAASLGVSDVCEGLNLRNGRLRVKGRESWTLW